MGRFWTILCTEEQKRLILERYLRLEVISINDNRKLKNIFVRGETLDPKDYFLTAIGLFASTFMLILIAGLLSMLAVSTEEIHWVYLTIPPALFAFTAGTFTSPNAVDAATAAEIDRDVKSALEKLYAESTSARAMLIVMVQISAINHTYGVG